VATSTVKSRPLHKNIFALFGNVLNQPLPSEQFEEITALRKFLCNFLEITSSLLYKAEANNYVRSYIANADKKENLLKKTVI
jgi:hypothetical protein